MEKSSLNPRQGQWNVDQPKFNKQPSNVREDAEPRIAIPSDLSRDLNELDEKVKSLMAKSTNNETEGWKKGYICKVCGKEGQSIHVQNHIESNHLEGFSVPCNLCEKTCRSRNALRKHISNDHE